VPLKFYKSEVFGKVFREKNHFWADSPRVHGGQSEINFKSYRTVCGSGDPRGRSARPWRTVRGFLADSPPGAMGTSDSH
jgi:hypothetical protein